METADLAAIAGDRTIPLRLYRPHPGAGLPLIIFSHGGGWVWGNLETHDALCRTLAALSGCAILAVDYRLSPEYRYPGPVQDVTDALAWARENASGLGIDATRLGLCGDSAGANLALSAACAATQQGIVLRHVSLIYPALDPACNTASQHRFAENHMLTREAMQWFWSCFLGDEVAQTSAASPIAPQALSGLPPVSIGVAEYDILHDEGVALSETLKRQGNDVRLHTFEGMLHGFLSLPITAEIVTPALETVASDIRERLGPGNEVTD
ncbi:alpha/beta hydrolase [Zhengella sp. ZM62]|uniref:alpha/beta hydrolase n=1 Tax=Zhengella sedimenti TaxID=3390035 RepID=UPI003975046D